MKLFTPVLSRNLKFAAHMHEDGIGPLPPKVLEEVKQFNLTCDDLEKTYRYSEFLTQTIIVGLLAQPVGIYLLNLKPLGDIRGIIPLFMIVGIFGAGLHLVSKKTDLNRKDIDKCMRRAFKNLSPAAFDYVLEQARKKGIDVRDSKNPINENVIPARLTFL